MDEFSSFATFEERKRKSNLLMSFPKIVQQKGSFGQIRKNLHFCGPILDIFGCMLLIDLVPYKISTIKSTLSLLARSCLVSSCLVLSCLAMPHGEPNYGSVGSEVQEPRTAKFWELKKSS